MRAVGAILSFVSEELKYITSVKTLHSELERKGHAFSNHLTEGCWQQPIVLMKYCFSNYLQRQHRKCKKWDSATSNEKTSVLGTQSKTVLNFSSELKRGFTCIWGKRNVSCKTIQIIIAVKGSGQFYFHILYSALWHK